MFRIFAPYSYTFETLLFTLFIWMLNWFPLKEFKELRPNECSLYSIGVGFVGV